jgi:asparagine synthase (glutamine-hydrolysing)
MLARPGGRLGAEDRASAEHASELLSHRGPDGEGVWSEEGGRFLLAHRRLAIIDPTPRASQPLVDPESGWRIVFNGEIYNYPQIQV